MVKKLDVAWTSLGDAFQQGSFETRFYLDLETGRVELVSEDLLFEDQDASGEGEDPYREMREVHEAVEAGSERYLAIPENDSREAWRDMETFVSTVADDRLADRLSQAIQGRGAFRSFRVVLGEHPEERERWYAFEARRVHQRILDWLEAKGIEPTRVPEPPEAPDSALAAAPDGTGAEERLLRDLTLVCLYLSSWREGVAGETYRRAWKGHRFEVLDALEEQGLVTLGRRGTKSLQLTDDGVDVARELLRRLVDRLA